MLYNIFACAQIYALIYLCTCVKERKNSYTNFIPEVININFLHIWHFEVKGTWWVGLEFGVILTQAVGRLDM